MTVASGPASNPLPATLKSHNFDRVHHLIALSVATGDALGTALDFKLPGSFEPITDMVGGDPFSLKPGQWTDDTSTALCLADSLVRKKRSMLQTRCIAIYDG
ncbi:MAG: ADP-ribosylglycohydrolase family protein [Pseudomonadota bacterium]